MKSARGAMPLIVKSLAFAVLMVSTTLPQDSEPSDRDLQANNPQSVMVGPCRLSAQVDPVVALIAEPITVKLTVDAPEGSSITFPAIEGALGTFFVIETRTAGELPIEGDATMRRWVANIQLESLESGEQAIPSFEISFQLPESFTGLVREREGTIRSKPIAVQITSVLAGEEEPTGFRDIKDLAELAPASERSSQVTWIGATIFGVLCALGLAYWIRRRGKPDPRRWASAEVERIKSEFESDAIDRHAVYSQLSLVLRRFLQAELMIPATAESTEEMGNELSQREGLESIAEPVNAFLKEADELKFSGRLRTGGNSERSPFDAVTAIINDLCQARETPSEKRAA